MQAFDSIKRFARRSRGADGGFSLVEVLIAMSILSVGLLALAQMQITAMQMNRANLNRAEAEIIAQERMENVINATWPNVGGLAGTFPLLRNSITYNVTTTVGAIVNLTRPVQVRVTYNDGKDRAVTFNTTKSQAEDPV
ncbi:MAG: prepilin-type N-terminal cleavage/methylation domain-containing protein [Deltaproteobacteria bacterium]|nr:prepilin-type N-terminal cleavage/methylation domain-containing protein [Deltaproteobacteria bacterium]